MIPAPFEVIPVEDGYTWRLIGACGRPLVYSQEIYRCNLSAAEGAKTARARHHERASKIDGGMLG